MSAFVCSPAHIGPPACKPSISDKWAYEIAQTWVSEGIRAAHSRVNALAIKHRLLDYEVVMIKDRIRYEYHWLSKELES